MAVTKRTPFQDVDTETNASRIFLSEVWRFFIIVILSAAVGSWFVTSGTVKKFNFYQNTYAPAVMLACGNGFVQPVPEPKILQDFLELRTNTLDCTSLSPDAKTVTPGIFQSSHRNLMLTVASWWRMFGISWTSLVSLYGLAYGLTAGFAYLLLRTAVRSPLAMVLTCIFVLSPPQLFNLPHLRDYIKAPFMLAAIAMIAWLLKGEIKPYQKIWALPATGLFIGIGIGFRIDLIILVPLIVGVILFMQPGTLFEHVKARLVITFVFLTSFLLAASPTLISLGGGSNMPHVIILGLMEEFDPKIGLDIAHYGLGFHYLDLYVHVLVNSFVHAAETAPTIPYSSPRYDKSGISYLIDVYQSFPADIVARYFGAVWRILHLPIEAPVIFEDLYFFYDDFRPQWLMNLTHHRAWEAVLIVAVSTSAALLACKSFKLLIFVFIVVLYLCGYPFLQFGVRHYFFLQVIGLCIFGLCIQYILLDPFRNWLRRRKLGTRPNSAPIDKHLWVSRGLRSLAAIALVFGLPLALLGILRVYQNNHLGTVFASYASAPTTTISTQQRDSDGGWKILQLSGASQYGSPSNAPSIKTVPLVATFDSKHCKKDLVQVRFKYESTGPTYDFSHTRSLGIDGHTRVFFPAFFQGDLSAFRGIEMPSEEIGCLVSLERFAVAPPLPIPLTITMPENWMDLPRYRTFR